MKVILIEPEMTLGWSVYTESFRMDYLKGKKALYTVHQYWKNLRSSKETQNHNRTTTEKKNYAEHFKKEIVLLNVMCEPGWVGSLGENGYMYMHDWVSLLFIWNYHNIVNWLLLFSC